MPAAIESFARLNGTKPAWHGLGGTWEADATLEEKARIAGLDWTVEESNVFYRVGNTAKVMANGKLFYRSDRPDTVITVKSDQFKPVQPLECLQFLDQMSNELGMAIDTAGVLQGGAKYWALATVGESVEPMPGDKINDHFLVATANDGSMATRIGPTRIRVVCQNTLNAAIGRGRDLLTINHRSTVQWNKVRDWAKGEHEDFVLFGDLMGALVNVPVNAEQAADFAHQLIAPEWDKKGKAPRKLTDFVSTLQNGVGQREAGPTAYGLINGVTRHVDHVRGRSAETRLNSAWFSNGQSLKNQAMDLLLKDCVTKWGEREAVAAVLEETKYAPLLAA